MRDDFQREQIDPKRHPMAAGPLSDAAEHYAGVAGALAKVAELFPFPGAGECADESRRREAAGLLREAEAAETKAVEALEQAQATSWDA